MIEVRECSRIEEFDACVALQREVFGYSDLEITPRRHLILSRRAGGWTLGAFNGDELVGFVHHLIAVRGGREIVGYSHMMAIRAGYQNRGVGARLKWAQRARALAEGRSYITWTWNPMQARNAHFNLNRLGVTVRSYGVNFYGTEQSVTARGDQDQLDSDRLFADWDLRAPRVAALAAGGATEPSPEWVEAIEIPPDWNALVRQDTAAARREQLRVRARFEEAFAAALVCAGFERNATRPRYLLYESKV
jgi:predicted GNAT superfamily acetyltransferase